MQLIDFITSVPDFPKPGIMFRDISPLLADPQAFQYSIDRFSALAKDLSFTHILAIESRGFIFGSALAVHLGKSLLLARKPNKLPLATHSQAYGLEYGNDALEVQAGNIPLNSKVLLIDDVLATGGTLLAAAHLMKQVSAEVVAAITLLEIKGLQGSECLSEHGIIAKSILLA
jgi:adenine phosphoribosyltransferase